MSFLGTIGNLFTGITSGIGSTNPITNFEQWEEQEQSNQLQQQEALQTEQDQFNDGMQQASEKAHETSTLQTFAQDITNAHNTLTSSDLQQIK